MADAPAPPSLWTRSRRPRRVVLLGLLLALAGLGAWGVLQAENDYGIEMNVMPFSPGGGGEGTVQPDGTRLYETHAHARISHPFTDAALAGLRTDDHIVSIGDVVLSDSTTNAERDAAKAARSGAFGTSVRVVVRRGGEEVAVDVVRGGRARELARSVGLSYPALGVIGDGLNLLIMLSACGVGGVLFLRARGIGYLAELGLAVVAFGALMALLGGAEWLEDHVWGYEGLLALGVPVALPLLVRTVARFPDGEARAPWVRYVHWVPVVVLCALIGGLMVFQMLAAVVDPEWRQTVDAVFSVLVLIGLVGGALAATAAALVSRYRRAADAEVRQQMKWVIVPLVLLVVTFVWIAGVQAEVDALRPNASLGTFLLSVAVGWLQALAFIALPLSILAGALRFRPWDADLWIGRSAAVGAATLGLAAIFAGGSEALRVGLRASMGEGADAVAAALAGVISVIVFNPTREWVQARAEKGLRRTRDILGERLPLVLSGRQVVAPVSEIARVAISGVREALATDRAAVFLRRPDGWATAGVHGLDLSDAAAWAEVAAAEPDGALPAVTRQSWSDPTFVLRVPLRSAEDEPVGLLALGTHGAGRGYSTEERRALDRLGRPLAEALLVAERREAVRDAEYSRLARLVDRLGGDGASTGEPGV